MVTTCSQLGRDGGDDDDGADDDDDGANDDDDGADDDQAGTICGTFVQRKSGLKIFVLFVFTFRDKL